MAEQNTPAPADLASLLTKAVGDITAALILAGKKDKIYDWTLPYITAINAHDALAAPADMVEAVKIWFDDQMEGQDETTPSSVQRQNGKTWIEGWFDLPAMLTAMQAYMASDGVTQMDGNDNNTCCHSCMHFSKGWCADRKAGVAWYYGCQSHRRAAAITPQPDPRDAEIERLRLDVEKEQALQDSAYRAGLKAGWNMCVNDDHDGYAKATESTEHIAELRRIREARAALAKEPKP